MKKTGFTLAEVLITLTIIGVIATLTLPTLMTNTAERQYVTGLKKVINTLSEAGQTNAALAGFDYGSITDATDGVSLTDNPVDANGNQLQSVYALLYNRTNLDFQKNGQPLPGLDDSAGRTIYFRDGSALVLDANDVSVEEGAVVRGGRILAVVDVNGAKGPNIMSTCGGADADGAYDITEVDQDAFNQEIAEREDACTAVATRIIRDRFQIRLEGGSAFPNNAAAQWAFDN